MGEKEGLLRSLYLSFNTSHNWIKLIEYTNNAILSPSHFFLSFYQNDFVCHMICVLYGIVIINNQHMRLY